MQALAHSLPVHSKNGLDYSVRKDGWKLLLNRDQEPVALYDLESDPYEMLNRLSALPAKGHILTARPEKLAELHREFKNKFLPSLPPQAEQAAPFFSN